MSVDVPCQYCNQMIPFNELLEHQETCYIAWERQKQETNRMDTQQIQQDFMRETKSKNMFFTDEDVKPLSPEQISKFILIKYKN